MTWEELAERARNFDEGRRKERSRVIRELQESLLAELESRFGTLNEQVRQCVEKSNSIKDLVLLGIKFGSASTLASLTLIAETKALPPFVLVTGNAGKIAEARLAMGADLEAVEVDLPEIQSLDYLEVLRAKAEEAWRRIGRPLVVEEAGLDLSALNGFPGPLVKWMLQAVGAEGLARTAASMGDVRASARCFLLYKDGDREIVAEGRTDGTLVLPGRGTQGFGWDPVFLPEGSALTFAELTGAEKGAVSHRGKAWRAFAASWTPKYAA